eukprot:scaffold11370_cov45-Phaeocystis_antarctica.AAC.1
MRWSAGEVPVSHPMPLRMHTAEPALLHHVVAALGCERGLQDRLNLNVEHLGRRRTAEGVVVAACHRVRLCTAGERVQRGHALGSVVDGDERLDIHASGHDEKCDILHRGVEHLRQLGRVGDLVKVVHCARDRGVEREDALVDHWDGRVEVVNVELHLLQRHLVRGVGPHEAEPELGARAEGQVDLGEAAAGAVAVLILVGIKVLVTLRDLHQQIEGRSVQVTGGAVAHVGLARVGAMPAEVAVQHRAAAQARPRAAAPAWAWCKAAAPAAGAATGLVAAAAAGTGLVAAAGAAGA